MLNPKDRAAHQQREHECTALEQSAGDRELRDTSLEETTLSGIYARTYETPKCEQCARLQADNRTLGLAIYRKQLQILELLGGDHNDSCCCFVVKLG